MTETRTPPMISTSDQAPPPTDSSATKSKLSRRIWGSVRGILTPIAAIVVALLISGLILLLAGYDPLLAFQVMWKGAFGDLRTITEVLLKATPLILIGVGLAAWTYFAAKPEGIGDAWAGGFSGWISLLLFVGLGWVLWRRGS